MSLDTLRNCPLFSALDDAQLAEAAADMRRVTLAAGSTLFLQGDEAQRYYVVDSGLIKLTRLSSDGEEKVIEMIRPGESFAEAVMFMDATRYPVTAQAVDDSVVLGLTNQRFLGLLYENNRLALRMLGQLSMRVHGLVQEIEKLTLHDATYRLVNYLIVECERSASTTLTAFKQVIASRLGITPETFSRLVQRLRNAGLLELHGAEVIIKDLVALRTYLIGN
ncbi:MAG: Crp/Fnr family transcriptional regulator [Acidihalobacter sp.]|uniref:Crp/Fnr family transcriptional regulator n=1 Tax=Acidihalobacter sp. TaxID=1872108 RepID=UPI00307F8183